MIFLKARRMLVLFLTIFSFVRGTLLLFYGAIGGVSEHISFLVSLIALCGIVYVLITLLSIEFVHIPFRRVSFFVFLGLSIVSIMLLVLPDVVFPYSVTGLPLVSALLFVRGGGLVALRKISWLAGQPDYSLRSMMHFSSGWFVTLTVMLLCIHSLVAIAQQERSCDHLMAQITKTTLFIGPILGLPEEKMRVLPEKISELSQRPVSDLLGLPAKDDASYDDMMYMLEQIQRQGQSHLGSGSAVSGHSLSLPPPLSRLQGSLVSQLFEKKDLIHSTLCGVVVEEIEKRAHRGRFNGGVFFLLFFVFSPLLHVLFRFFFAIARGVFSCLVFFQVYKRETITKEVQQLR